MTCVPAVDSSWKYCLKTVYSGFIHSKPVCMDINLMNPNGPCLKICCNQCIYCPAHGPNIYGVGTGYYADTSSLFIVVHQYSFSRFSDSGKGMLTKDSQLYEVLLQQCLFRVTDLTLSAAMLQQNYR